MSANKAQRHNRMQHIEVIVEELHYERSSKFWEILETEIEPHTKHLKDELAESNYCEPYSLNCKIERIRTDDLMSITGAAIWFPACLAKQMPTIDAAPLSKFYIQTS